MNDLLQSRLAVMIFALDFDRNNFNEAEEISNKSLDERDEQDERVASHISKCSDETDDERSVSELIGSENLFHYTNVYQIIRDVHTHVEQLAIEFFQIAFNNLQYLLLSRVILPYHSCRP